MTDSERDDLVDRIAATFTTKLFEALGDIKMHEVMRRNRSEENPNVCHSHDFCDANMIMADAFSEETGRDLDVADEGDAALCNEAWELARVSRFESAFYRR